MKPKAFEMELQWAKTIAPAVRHLAFKRVDGQPLPFISGQFITIYFEYEGKRLNRSYSLATIPGQSELTEFAVSHVEGGPASELLFSIKPKETLEASGPFGRLILQKDTPKRYLLLATGTGIAPFRSMLPELAKRLKEHLDLEVVLALGVRGREHLLYGDELAAFAKEYPRCQFFACYSREFPEVPMPYEHKGRVHTLFERLMPDPRRDMVYLCGNPKMIDEAFEFLRSNGFTSPQVRREKYISPHEERKQKAAD